MSNDRRDNERERSRQPPEPKRSGTAAAPTQPPAPRRVGPVPPSQPEARRASGDQHPVAQRTQAAPLDEKSKGRDTLVAKHQPTRELTTHQKQQLDSGFIDPASARQRNVLGLSGPSAPEPEAAPVTAHFDGLTAPPDLTSRDLWKALVPPVTSVPGKRSAKLTSQVIAQFAVGTNPRYEPSAGKPHGHIFVWDVTRAMGCEVPHFLGARELSLAQTVDWLRHEGPMRGWRRVADHDALEVCQTGTLVLAVPRDIKVKHIAVVEPQAPPSDFRPRVTGAGNKRGGLLTLVDCFGTRLTDYFTHD
jgi:hypothetical protein